MLEAFWLQSVIHGRLTQAKSFSSQISSSQISRVFISIMHFKKRVNLHLYA